jgi:hypothetical protein
MTKLAKFAALATIVGTLFTIYAYYKDGKTISILSPSRESLKGNGSQQSVQVEDKELNYCELLIKEIDLLPSSDMNELMARHKAAKEIPYDKDMSDALFHVVKICLKNQQLDYASKVAKDIPYAATMSDAYRAIALFLPYNGQFENAITAAKKIPYAKTQSLALKEISAIRKNPKLMERNKSELPNQQIQPMQKPHG